MARPKLSALLEDKTPAQAPEATESPAAPPAERARPRTAEPEPERFEEFERKEAKLREDQLDDLAVLAKRLSRRRTAPGRRITENTLIRVAVDLLLERQGDLRGNDESQLRDSVGL